MTATAAPSYRPGPTTPPVPDASPAAFARARDEGRAALIPYVVGGYPDADTELRDRPRRGRCRRRPARSRAAVQRPPRRRGDAPARFGRGAAGRRDAGGLAAADRADRRRRVRTCRSCRWPTPTRSSAVATGRPWRDGWLVPEPPGVIVADLTPDEGAPFEAVAREAGLAVVYLVAPTTPPARRAMIAARSGGFLYCVSLVGVTGARSALPASVGRARARRAGRLAGPGGGRLRRQHAGARQGDRGRRRRRRHRRVGAGRCLGPRRPRHPRIDRLGEGPPRRDVTVTILGVPTNSAGKQGGVASAPEALRRAGLVGPPLVDGGDIVVDPPTGIRGDDGVIDGALLTATLQRTRAEVADVRRRGRSRDPDRWRLPGR